MDLKIISNAEWAARIFPKSVQSEALESETSVEGYRRGDASPTLAGSLRTPQGEPARVAFWVQAAAGLMPRYPQIRRMLLGVTSPAIGPRIGAARDAEKRMLKWSEGMEPHFIS